MEEKLENENNLNNEEIEEVKAFIVSSDESKTGVTEEELAYFIWDNAEKYLTKFRKFNVDGVDRFAATWHWPAFFFSYIWMAHRKLYVWALLAFILMLIPGLNFVSAVFFGVITNYIYYKHAKKKIIELKSTQIFSDSTEMSIALHKIGGVNPWAAILAIIAPFILVAL